MKIRPQTSDYGSFGSDFIVDNEPLKPIKICC